MEQQDALLHSRLCWQKIVQRRFEDLGADGLPLCGYSIYGVAPSQLLCDLVLERR